MISVKSIWDDEVEVEQALPEPGTKLLADDWQNGAAWHVLRGHAERDACRYVLSNGSYREADPALLTGSLLARNALLTQVSTSALRGIGNSGLLEQKGFWPKPDETGRDVSSLLWKMACDCLAIINSFLVEDEESLQSLYQACDRELMKGGSQSEIAKVAQGRVRLGLRNAGSDVLTAVASNRGPRDLG